MAELVANFSLEETNIDALFEIKTTGTTWGSIVGNLADQTDLQAALNAKQDIIADLEAIRTGAQNGDFSYSTILTYGDIVTYNAAAFATAAQGALAETALQSITSSDITTALGYTPYNSSNPAGYTSNVGTVTSVNNVSPISGNVTLSIPTDTSELTNGAGFITGITSSDVTTALGYTPYSSNNPNGFITGINSSDVTTALGYIPYNATNPSGYITSAALTDYALLSDIPTDNLQLTNGAGYITNSALAGYALLSDVPTTAADVGALADTTTINDLTTAEQQSALNSGANTTNIGQIATNTQNISNEVTNRQNADNALQSQIDALVVSSDVFDVVGTYADLQAYDISTVPVNDIIKVLVDSTHDNAATYYRCVENDNVKSWSYIGAEGAYYTKSEADSKFVEQTTTINGQALSNNITLDASDVGALPDSTVIGNGTLTIQKNGSTIDSFGANDTGNTTVNISVPTDTGDLTNNAGYIKGINSTDVTNALGYTPYNSTNPDGYTDNVGTVTSVNNVSPVNGNVTLSIPAAVTVDSALSSTSTNPVQNKVITSALNDKADDSAVVKKDGGSSQQTVQLSSGTGTTAFGVKTRATSSYISFSNSTGWIGSYGVSSNKKPTFYNGTGYTLACTSDIPTIATSVSPSSTNAETVGAKLFYDTVGNIESALNTINSGSST